MTDIQVTVKTGNGKSTMFQVKDDFTIEQLSKLVCDRHGVQLSELKLLFAGKPLVLADDSGKANTLKTYNIEDESLIMMIHRTRGGMDLEILVSCYVGYDR